MNFVDDYVVFDLETTGIDPLSNKIIEIGALKYKENKLVEEFNCFVNPHMILPQVITQITGITNEDLKNELSIEEILPQFIEFIGDLPIIAHNANFDIAFVEHNLKLLGKGSLTNQCIDTLELAKHYIPKAYNYKLATLKNFFKLNFGSHRSLEDCYTTNYVYQYCKKQALVKN